MSAVINKRISVILEAVRDYNSKHHNIVETNQVFSTLSWATSSLAAPTNEDIYILCEYILDELQVKYCQVANIDISDITGFARYQTGYKPYCFYTDGKQPASIYEGLSDAEVDDMFTNYLNNIQKQNENTTVYMDDILKFAEEKGYRYRPPIYRDAEYHSGAIQDMMEAVVNAKHFLYRRSLKEEAQPHYDALVSLRKRVEEDCDTTIRPVDDLMAEYDELLKENELDLIYIKGNKKALSNRRKDIEWITQTSKQLTGPWGRMEACERMKKKLEREIKQCNREIKKLERGKSVKKGAGASKESGQASN